MNKRVALVIGIGHYEHFSSLEYCPPSAQEVYELFTSPQLGQCDPERSVLKTVKDESESLTVSELDGLASRVIGSLVPGDQFLFFFSGHAKVHPRNEDLYLLLPASRQDTWLDSYDFSARLVKPLSDNGLNKAILIVDACHSEAMFASIKHFQGDWTPARLPKGLVYMAASGKTQYARQEPQLKRTLFSYYFCQGLKEWKDTHAPYITPSALKDYINREIETHHAVKQLVHTLVREGEEAVWLARNPAYSRASVEQDFSRKPPRIISPERQPMSNTFNLKNIRALLTEGFSHEELLSLCWDTPVFRPVYDEWADNPSKAKFIRKLIEHAERKGLIKELLAVIDKELNSAKDKKQQPDYEIITNPIMSDYIPDRHILLMCLEKKFALYELKRICFSLDMEWNNLAGGVKSDKIISLIEFAERRNKIKDLYAAMQDIYPGLEC